MKVVLEFDDFNENNHLLSKLFVLKNKYPQFKCTMFAIPDHCPEEFIKGLPDWIELCFHGKSHTPLECQSWNRHDVIRYDEYSAKYQRLGFKRIFRPPYWVLSQEAYEQFMLLGWKLALHPDDKRLFHYTYTWNLKDAPDLSKEILYGHGHIQNVCGNGIEESMNRIMMLPEDTEFLFLSEILR